MRRFIYFPFLVFTFIIIYLSLANIGKLNFDIGFLTWDKFWHAFVYFIDCSLLLMANRVAKALPLAYNITLSFFLCFLIGAVLEYLQFALTTYRSFDYADMIANGFGSFISCLLYVVFFSFLSRNKT